MPTRATSSGGSARPLGFDSFRFRLSRAKGAKNRDHETGHSQRQASQSHWHACPFPLRGQAKPVTEDRSACHYDEHGTRGEAQCHSICPGTAKGRDKLPASRQEQAQARESNREIER